MLGGDGDAAGIEMTDLRTETEEDPVDQDYHLTEKPEKVAAGQSYDRRFDSILSSYCFDEEDWWEKVEDLLQNDGDFAEKVGRVQCPACACTQLFSLLSNYDDAYMQVTEKLQAVEKKPMKTAAVEVLVDLLLSMEGITVHQGLVYVLDKRNWLQIYPVSGAARQQYALCT